LAAAAVWFACFLVAGASAVLMHAAGSSGPGLPTSTCLHFRQSASIAAEGFGPGLLAGHRACSVKRGRRNGNLSSSGLLSKAMAGMGRWRAWQTLHMSICARTDAGSVHDWPSA
jgi:hypothetical protein